MGVHHNTLPLVAVVRTLAAAEFERDPAGAQAALSLLAGFAKWHRVEFLGFPRRPPAQLPPEVPSEVTLPHSLQCLSLQLAKFILVTAFCDSVMLPRIAQVCRVSCSYAEFCKQRSGRYYRRNMLAYCNVAPSYLKQVLYPTD